MKNIEDKVIILDEVIKDYPVIYHPDKPEYIWKLLEPALSIPNENITIVGKNEI